MVLRTQPAYQAVRQELDIGVDLKETRAVGTQENEMTLGR